MYCPNRDCPDVKLTGLPGEYRPEITVCPKCGSRLVPAVPEFVVEGEKADEVDVVEYETFVSVRYLQNTALIPLAKFLLRAAGIRHFVKNEKTHDLVGYPRMSPGGYNPFIGIPEVFVEPERAEEARELLAGLEE